MTANLARPDRDANHRVTGTLGRHGTSPWLPMAVAAELSPVTLAVFPSPSGLGLAAVAVDRCRVPGAALGLGPVVVSVDRCGVPVARPAIGDVVVSVDRCRVPIASSASALLSSPTTVAVFPSPDKGGGPAAVSVDRCRAPITDSGRGDAAVSVDDGGVATPRDEVAMACCRRPLGLHGYGRQGGGMAVCSPHLGHGCLTFGDADGTAPLHAYLSIGGDTLVRRDRQDRAER